MRAPFQKAPAPRIRAFDGAARTRGGTAKSGAVTAPGSVFRDFVSTLEKLDKARRRRMNAAPSGSGSGASGKEG